MKKLFSLLAVLALVSMAGTAFAAAVTRKATASFSNVAVTINVDLYDWLGAGKDFDSADYTPKTGAGSDVITFEQPEGFVTGSDTPVWINSKVFARVSSNLIGVGAGTTVYLYTNNKNNPTATYVANAADTNGNYSGLIRAGNGSTYKTGDHAIIRLAFACISDTKNTEKPAYGYRTTLPDFSTGGISGNDRFYSTGFRYLNDKANLSTLNPQEKVLGISGSSGGLWVGMKDSDPWTQWYKESGEDVLIFFGAEFVKVVGGDTYATETIIFGAETE